MEDIESVNRQPIELTTKAALIAARVGQGKFRESLLDLWGHCCAVTGSKTSEAIRASHIKAWRDSSNEERLDPYNGIPLLATLDALFDRGLISFEASGKMVISPKLTSADRKLLNIQEVSLIKVPHTATLEYLSHHREKWGFKDDRDSN